jgi:hypothetical protein
LFAPLVVRQTTRTWSEMWAFEMNTFWPLMTKPPLERTASVLSEPTSEPASGSVIAIASTEPFEMPPRISCFCSSVPNLLVAPANDQGGGVAADGRHPAGGLLHEEGGVEHGAAGAAVLLRDGEAEPAEVGHLLGQDHGHATDQSEATATQEINVKLKD